MKIFLILAVIIFIVLVLFFLIRLALQKSKVRLGILTSIWATITL